MRNRLAPTEPSMPDRSSEAEPDPDPDSDPVAKGEAAVSTCSASVQIGSGRSCQTSPVRSL